MKRDQEQLEKAGVLVGRAHFAKMTAFIQRQDTNEFEALMKEARHLRHEALSYHALTPAERFKADRAARDIQVCIAMAVFVIICFVTEAIPLPGVALSIGLILVFAGIVTRRNVAALFWSDAVWFIMGSLMFAAAFVKTGVDKRICLALFRRLATPSIRLITAIMILVISPAAAFISDHALAAMFLPIGIILYTNSVYTERGKDKELAKMLMICIAMACNIGGFGSPSGGARNVVIMTYLEDMFGITLGYGEWILFGMPFVIIMMPVLWGLINWRFKPKIRNLGGALAVLKSDIDKTGGWSRAQIAAVTVFLVMLFTWITEKNLLSTLLGVRLGIGVIAVAGAVAYLLLGIVSWQDYQEKVDWGVVWLYAGATIFGRVLDETGAAYWAARSVVEGLSYFGAAGGGALIAMGSAVTAVITNLMADGPAAASVGPITLNMAAVTAPGTTAVPFMGLATACASSFAYLLVIGTPPNAIVYASGFLDAKDFLRVGIPCFVIAFVVLMLMVLLLWPLIGLHGMPPG
jgi:anion transporter